MAHRLELPHPPPSEGAASASPHETRHLMRERAFPTSPEIISTARKLASLLGLARDTGTLILDMNSGGVGTIRFHEKHKL